ncbi:glycosyltransferase family 2 protein [Psychrobacter sp. SCQQ22]|uniref:glycosyltransferase family 2 protein n=1 Tax=unclassified Psychrobacter TaxID=196806 RepID=UPI0018CDA304|nr:glycosyltransferase family 2 protein [Psychrobacter sp. SCQQ22]MBH0087061.1 glycosyltransferase family 2 protein [Psychrobacter sp. SCQQ22]
MTIAAEPLVSIIVPVYNVASYIDACLASIKQQTYKNIEIIVVEDCSTDNSKQALTPHLTDKRIKVIQHNENSGLSAARNTGIKSAIGEYMMFVDSDDIVDIRLVAACVDCALTTNAEVVTYGFVPFKEGVVETELPYPAASLVFAAANIDDSYFSLPHFAWLKFIRSSVVRSASLHFPVGLYYEDWPFHWHLGLSAKVRYQLPIDFYLYRQRGTSITGSTDKKLLDLFVIHSEVMSLVESYQADEVKKILANKIRQSHWSILTRIDNDYLTTALVQAKKADKTLRLKGYESDSTLRNIVISNIVRMPSQVALSMLQVLRQALDKRARMKG